MVNRRGANWRVALAATALFTISPQANGDSATAHKKIQSQQSAASVNGLGGSGLHGVGGSGNRGLGGFGTKLNTLNSNPTGTNVGGIRGLGGTGIKTSSRVTSGTTPVGNQTVIPKRTRTKAQSAPPRGLGGTGITTRRTNPTVAGVGGSGAKLRTNPRPQRRVNQRAGTARK